MIRYFLHKCLSCALAFSSITLLAEPLKLELAPSPSPRPISPHLVGLHQVYTFTPDSVFTDGNFTEWVRDSGVSASRFPGGTIVKYWDWEQPTGQPFVDPLGPDFDSSLNPPSSEWMSLDEFLDFAKTTGIAPILGVNCMEGKIHNREAECIARAVRMVRHVKQRGFGGDMCYIGNEEAHKHGGIEAYAQTFGRYAAAMKQEDPNIKLFWNDNGANETRIQAFLANDGGTADGLETHGKWPFGGKPGLPRATFEEWTTEVPLRDRKNGNRAAGGRKWREAAHSYRAGTAAVGRNLLVANNEYGLGSNHNLSGFDRYTTGLLLSEMLLEHFVGDWYSTCYWDLTRKAEKGLIDPANDYRLNPFHLGMELLADAQGGDYLETLATEHHSVHGFAAKQEGKLIIYILNKSTEAHTLSTALGESAYTQSLARRMQNSKDGYGELINVSVKYQGDHFTANLPPLTLTQFIFTTGESSPNTAGR